MKEKEDLATRPTPAANAAAIAHWDRVISDLRRGISKLQRQLENAQAIRHALEDPTIFAHLIDSVSPALPIRQVEQLLSSPPTQIPGTGPASTLFPTTSGHLAGGDEGYASVPPNQTPRGSAFEKVFGLLSGVQGSLTIREIAEGTGINRNTVYDVLLTSHRGRFIKTMKEGSKKVTLWRLRREDESPQEPGRETEDEE